MINYQGKLTDAGGGLVNDTVQMTFSIYPDTLGSPADWSETQTQVIVENGIFNVLLGAVDTIPLAVFDGNVKYLGVQVESDPEMTPLKPMVSVAYAYRAGTADGGGGGGGWVDDGDVVRLETTTDSVGIGTNQPIQPVHVVGPVRWQNANGGVIGELNFDTGLDLIGIGSTVGGAGAASLSLWAGGAERFRIDQSGNVGIGTTSPQANLHTYGDVSIGDADSANPSGARLYVRHGPNQQGIHIKCTSPTNVYAPIAVYNTWDQSIFYIEPGTDDVGIGTAAPDAKLHVVGNGLYSAFLMNGNVGIGTTTPTEQLEVSGNIKASGTITSGSSITIDGATDKITATSGTIDFDDENIVTTGNATIGPGHTNTGSYTLVAGYSNTASANKVTVAGGQSNTASNGWDAVVGGLSNTASGGNSFVGGGQGNTASAAWAAVCGGLNNTASAGRGTVAGGQSNAASGTYAAVGGGTLDTASGQYATVPGGGLNRASGNFSFAAGRRAKADHSGTFVWADGTNADFASTGSNQFLIRASGGVGIGTTSPSEELHVVGDICYTGTIGACSDARYKKNVETLTGSLDRLLKLRGVNFQWKQDEFPDNKFEEGNQIGFIAQELKELLPEVVTQGNDGYYSVDYSRLTPILVEAVKELKAENQTLRAELAELSDLVKTILAKQNDSKSGNAKLAVNR
jgi:hypothetical protein